MGVTTILANAKLARFDAWAVVCVGLLVFTSTGCAKKADVETCKRACAHVAKLRTAPKMTAMLGGLHELEERDEALEDQSKDRVAEIKRELAAPVPAIDEASLRARKLSTKARETVIAQKRDEQKRDRELREQALVREKEAVEESHKSFAAAKAKTNADIQRLIAEATAACAEHCPKRSLEQVECLLRTQAVEDIAICERK